MNPTISFSNPEHKRNFLTALYSPDDTVLTAGPSPAVVNFVGPASGPVPDADYIALNPVGPEGERKAHLMGSYGNFLLEFDNCSLQEQHRLLALLAPHLPLRTVVYSGGKSLHAIISMQDTLVLGDSGQEKADEYKEYAKALIGAATTFLTPHLRETTTGPLIDRANCDASRLTRLGGGVNNQFKKDRPVSAQPLLSVGPLCTSERFMAFVSEYRPKTSTRTLTATDSTTYHHSFAHTLNTVSHLSGLKRKLKNPALWAGNAGNHPEVLKLTLWAIDKTGVGMEEFKEYFFNNTAPYILSLGYPKWKLEASIDGAYRLKQMRSR